MQESYKKRIGYAGRIRDISRAISERYNLGEVLSDRLVTVGYEDFNLELETRRGKYFAKIFANFRSDRDCERYVDVVTKAIKAGVATPRVMETDGGYLQKLDVTQSRLRICLMEFIDGQTIFHSKEFPTEDEIKFLAKQASLINSIRIKPKPVYDSWSITNFLKEFSEKGRCLSVRDRSLVEPLIEEFESLQMRSLPHCFVHGDVISTNVMRDENDRLHIIDFSVSNYYPRIQELAVLACDLLFNPKSREQTDRNLEIALKAYQRRIKLTNREHEALPTYVNLAHAMHILGASYYKVELNNNSKENRYWLQRGRLGLTSV